MHAEQQLWRTEKYRVMYYSQAHYNQIRHMMRDGCTLDELQQTINEALALTPTDDRRTKGALHQAVRGKTMGCITRLLSDACATI